LTSTNPLSASTTLDATTSTAEFVAYVRSLDVKLWLEGDRLRLNAPKGAITSELRDELARRKPAIADFLQAANLPQPTPLPPLRRIAREGRLALSFPQQRLWLIDQLSPGNAAYNIVGALRLIGQLDVRALERSFREIVQRHEALRTTFAVEDGQPVQRIAPASSFQLEVTDVRHLSGAEQEREVQQLVRAEALRPFDLAQDEMLRARLILRADQDAWLLIVMHHIAADGWSLGVLSHELEVLYPALLNGRSSPLPELPVQYADFAHWQRQWLQAEVLEAQLRYWKQQLRGSLPVIDLLTDRPRPATPSYRGALQSIVLPLDLVGALNELSRAEGATLFMTLLAAFKMLLRRYTGQDDLLVGTPIANRNQIELEGLIGCFVNTLVMRTRLDGVSGDPTFRELLRRVREVALAAYAHQDAPFEAIVEALQPERDASHSPLFQVMFILQNAPLKMTEWPGLTLAPIEFDPGTAKFDLTLTLWEKPTGMGVYFEYSTDLFEAETITRWMSHFQTLLYSVVRDPDQKLSRVSLLAEAERHTLLIEWNQRLTEAAEAVQGRCLAELFESQVARTPDAVAVVFDDQALTYAELNDRADRLAAYLCTLGVGPDVLVGICVERSLEMLVGLLGVLKAGGAYVPLDPMFPRDRLAYMIDDAHLPVLITQQHLQAELVDDLLSASTHQPQVVCLDQPWEPIASTPRSVEAVTPDNLAYVIYTSGSTGRPKGVQVVQRAVVNFLASMRVEPGLNAADTLLAVTTLSFDIAGLELFLPLVVGARVVIANSAVVADGPQLMALMEHSNVTVMQATPATWRLLIQSGWRGDRGLKILCGGEALPRELADQLLARCGELWNMYGPTETTIWSTVYQIQPGEGAISIGRPIANTQIYILDAHLQPVPIGVAGELYIGGNGLARGYFKRPELTAEKFIRDPFAAPASGGGREGANARLYKTGDLARYHADGTIEFLGRIDHQVKIRGFRIELGEIETVLAQHAQVRQAVVVAREDTPGDKRLVAYLIARLPAPSVTDLRSFLKEQLPDYMVPAAFVMLEAFPLTPNGKVDRKALPVAEGARPQLDANYVAPQTEIERSIAAIWQDVLKTDRVGIHDNFFDLGGHSLLIVQVHARLRSITPVPITIADMFRFPTIATLASFLNRVPDQPVGSDKVHDRIAKQHRADQLRHESRSAL